MNIIKSLVLIAKLHGGRKLLISQLAAFMEGAACPVSSPTGCLHILEKGVHAVNLGVYLHVNDKYATIKTGCIVTFTFLK